MLDQLAFDIEPVSRQDLLARLEEHKVRIMTGAEILACEDRGLRVRLKNQQENLVKADKAVPCLGYRSVQELETSLQHEKVSLHTIGDCRRPRMIIDAISEAYEVASKI
jgi:glucose-6-phosphate dehydrogenase assembly protein OpcA